MEQQWSSLVLGLIGAGGLGGLVSTVLNSLISGKRNLTDRRFREKQDAYLGLLQALTDAEISIAAGGPHAGIAGVKKVGLYFLRVQLVGSPEVITAPAANM